MSTPALSVVCHELRLFSSFGIGPGLICPRCGSDYLHSGQVKVYDRLEDEDTTHVTIVENGLTATHIVASEAALNPSLRRQGVAIRFECEQCEGPLELTIAQHKGGTYVAWRYSPRVPVRIGVIAGAAA